MLHLLAKLGMDGCHHASLWRANHVFHLHRFEHQEFITGLHVVSNLHMKLQDHPRNRRAYGTGNTSFCC